MSKKLKIEKVKSKEKWNLLSCKEDQSDSFQSNTHIEIINSNNFTLEGCLKVLEYNESYIKLKLNKGVLILCGKDFKILFFENKVITVKGFISNIEFSCV